MATAQRKTARPPDNRFRVYVHGKFACVVHAADEGKARNDAIAGLEVRQVAA